MAINFSEPLATLAVVSDLHAFSSPDKSTESVLDFTSNPRSGPNPLRDLIATAKQQNTKADALICSGDICNQADYGGLESAWRELHNLQEALSAESFIATCGNHDLDSRFLSGDPDPDPKGGLLKLSPPFPFEDEHLANKYWAKNYAIITLRNGLVIATLNSSAYHGGKQEEILHGRVSRRTIDALSSDLQSTREASGHVLVCHHHPLPLSGWTSGANDTEFMKNGQDLLDALIDATGRSWLIIHGHRHKPRLISGASSRSAVPFVIGAGSLGARITGIPNQFHLIRLYASEEIEHSSIVGTVETWFWTDATRWSTGASAGGLPPFCGFGYRGQIEPLASAIEDAVGDEFQSWSAIRSQLPSVDLLMPDDLRELETALKQRGVNFLRLGDGRIHQVGK